MGRNVIIDGQARGDACYARGARHGQVGSMIPIRANTYHRLGDERPALAGVDGAAVGPGHRRASQGAGGAHGLGARLGVRHVAGEHDGHGAALNVLARLVGECVGHLQGLARHRRLGFGGGSEARGRE